MISKKNKGQFEETNGEGIILHFWMSLCRIPHSSFSQLYWVAPLISSEMWWITKLSSSYPIERGMPRGRNGELGLAVLFPVWDELLTASPSHLDSPFHSFLTSSAYRETLFFKVVVQAPSPYAKVKHYVSWLYFSVEIVWQTSLQGQQRCLC